MRCPADALSSNGEIPDEEVVMILGDDLLAPDPIRLPLVLVTPARVEASVGTGFARRTAATGVRIGKWVAKKPGLDTAALR